MPLIIKDFKWRQTPNIVVIQIPSHGISQSKIDLFTSPNYIKASFERYFFEAFLLHEINVKTSLCTLTDKEIVFELNKEEERTWETLEVNISKSEKMDLKKKLIDEEFTRYQKEVEDKKIQESELKRLAVREQIKLDTKQRQCIENIKTTEKQHALQDINKWKDKNGPKIVELSSDEEEEEKEQQKPKQEIETKPKVIEIKPRPVPNYTKVKMKPVPNQVIPLPRKTATLEVDFTVRAFPTPSRESRLDEENEWLKNQTAVRRSVGFVSEDLRPEEKNPQYLKSKGDEFLKARNYLGAISAYSFGIKLCDKFSDLYVSRSEAQLAIGNWHRTIQDTSKALELMMPAVSANYLDRLTCIRRRGTALCKIGMYREGIQELEVAIKMQPDNPELQTLIRDAISQLEEQERVNK